MIVVQELTLTCPAFPAQWEGRTADGGYLYVRYRSGALRIGLGASEEAAIENAMGERPALLRRVGGPFDGEMDYGQLRALTAHAFRWP